MYFLISDHVLAELSKSAYPPGLFCEWRKKYGDVFMVKIGKTRVRCKEVGTPQSQAVTQMPVSPHAPSLLLTPAPPHTQASPLPPVSPHTPASLLTPATLHTHSYSHLLHRTRQHPHCRPCHRTRKHPHSRPCHRTRQHPDSRLHVSSFRVVSYFRAQTCSGGKRLQSCTRSSCYKTE